MNGKRLKRVGAVLLCITVINAVIVGFTQPKYSDVGIGKNVVVDSVSGLYKRDGKVGFDHTACDTKGYCTVLRDGFKEVLKNDEYSLLFNEQNGQIALSDNSNGSIIYSNPSEQEIENEAMLSGTVKDALRAQFEVDYYDANGNFYKNDSYNDSIVYGNLTYSLEDDSLKVSYKLGKNEVTLADVPQQISDKRFEEILSKLSDKEAKELKSQYKKVSIKGKKDQKTIDGYIEKYPNIEKNDIYYLQYSSSRILEKVLNLLNKAGYTAEDLKLDNEENKVVTEGTQSISITVVLNYALTNEGLSVTVNAKEISALGGATVSTLKLLPYFGYGSTADDGYIMLPDGSGALMHFNNGKNASSFSMKVYGDDTAFSTVSDYVIDKKLSLPIFGIKKNSEAFIAIITEGDAFATINAATSGTNNSFNYAQSEFLINATDTVILAKGSETISTEKKPYEGRYTIEYRVTQEKNYIGMADTYRKFLIENKMLDDGKSEFATVIDAICGVTVQKNFLGISIPSVETLTTYSHVSEILKDLQQGGAKGINLRLEGWFNNGIEQQYASKIKLLDKLGGKKEFKTLQDLCDNNGVPLFTELSISSIYAEGHGFNKSSMNIRGISDDTVVRYYYDYTNRYRRFNNKSISQLTPAYFEETSKEFIKSAEKLGDFGLSLTDISAILYSDFANKHYYTRQASRDAVVAALEILSERTLSAANPNVYALKNLSLITDLPLTSSFYKCCDESIPFYQAVLHGYVTYACEPLNYADDYRTQLLNAVEYGSGLQYTLSYESTSKLKNTDFSYLNNGEYDDWKNQIKKDSEKVYEVLNQISECTITSHEMVEDNLYRTGYSDGSYVYVNYNDNDIKLGDIVVGGKDFCLVKGEKR